MAGRLFFACRLVVLRSVRLGRPCCLSGCCGVSSSCLSRCLSLSWRFALPVRRSRFSRARSRPCRHASCRGLISSSHHLIALRTVLSIRRAGSVAVPVLAAWGGSFSCPHDVLSSRPVLACAGGLLASSSCLLSSSSRPSCCSAARFASLRHSPRLTIRWEGRCLAVVVLGHARRSFSLLAVRGTGRRVRMACYHLGSFSLWGREGVLCGLCGGDDCLPVVWYICLVS